jgi:hypothetical protein
MPHEMERSLATPIIKPRLPFIKPSKAIKKSSLKSVCVG